MSKHCTRDPVHPFPVYYFAVLLCRLALFEPMVRASKWSCQQESARWKQLYLSLDFEVVRALTFFGLGLREFADD